jgi:hypothetical protein
VDTRTLAYAWQTYFMPDASRHGTLICGRELLASITEHPQSEVLLGQTTSHNNDSELLIVIPPLNEIAVRHYHAVTFCGQNSQREKREKRET